MAVLAGALVGDLDPERKKALGGSLARLGVHTDLEVGETDLSHASGAGDLEAALRLLRGANQGSRELALQAALEAAVARGTLGLVQNRVLRLIVEALGLGLPYLRAVFRERTGHDLPDPWDPGDPEAWKRRSTAPPSPWDDARTEAPPPRPAQFPANQRIERIKALALLGLDEGASLDEVKRAFHRVSKVHHPDSFAGLGDDAMADAATSFRRIREAYEFLTREGVR